MLSNQQGQIRELMKYFALDYTATGTAELIGISMRSVNSTYLRIRHRVAEACEFASPLKGAVEVDES